jgi:uncharacterized protein (TIGR00251 family)
MPERTIDVDRLGLTEVDVRVTPNARRNAVVGMVDEVLRVKVAAPATDERANAELERFLADLLGVRPRQVSIIRGRRSRSKRLRIDGVAPDEIRTRLQRLAPPPEPVALDDLPLLAHDAK